MHLSNQRHAWPRSDVFIHPLQERAATAAAKDLLGRPKRVSGAAAVQPDHVSRGQAQRRECQGFGRVWQLQQDDASAGDPGQRGPKQPQLDNPGLLQRKRKKNRALIL